MPTGGWTIKEWNRALGRGVITSDQVGDLLFDASAAAVDDFVIGEAVDIKLDRSGGGRRVAMVWPDNPRFTPRTDSVVPAPPLAEDVAAALETVLSRVPWTIDYRVHSWVGDDLTVEGDDDLFAYGANIFIRFSGVQYVELPARWSGRPFRLANHPERSYVATRCELEAATVVIRVVDDDKQIFFIASAGFEWKRI